jgi:hypothetical protein
VLNIVLIKREKIPQKNIKKKKDVPWRTTRRECQVLANPEGSVAKLDP